MSFTGISPKDEQPMLVPDPAQPTRHEHGILPQFMTEPKNVDEMKHPLGYQEHKPPSHPSKFPEHRLGPLPSKPSARDYESFSMESASHKTSRKFWNAPVIPLGIAGCLGAVVYGIYKFRRSPKTVSASSYFVQLRVVAQSIAVGAVASLAFYQFYSNVMLERQSDTVVKEAVREGNAFILNPSDSHHKLVYTDENGRDKRIEKQ